MAPIEYQEGGSIDLKVNKLTSVKTQLPYGYYTLPYCAPPAIQESAENLGEILTGDQIENSAYQINMREEVSCKELCKKALTNADKNRFKSMIEDEYSVNWIVDNLPGAMRVAAPEAPGGAYMVSGFPIGAVKKGRHYVYNHVRLSFLYHNNPEMYVGWRIVGFEVEPRSLTSAVQGKVQPDHHPDMCNAGDDAMSFELDSFDQITFTYDVRWTESAIRWASRWDTYLAMGAPRVHWFSILNSLMIMVFLSGMIAMILLRTLHRDITKYNELATKEEAAEETGWKLVHGDVFRRPVFSRLLAVSVGSGVQILGMSVVTLLFALFGFLSPAHRGGLLQSVMILFTFMGAAAGFASARLYKIYGGEDWKTTTLLTAFFYPGLFFIVFFILNLFIWEQKSSGAVPFITMFAVLVLWFGISVPLTFLGFRFGFRMDAIELPVKTNEIPRQIPTQPWFANKYFSCLTGGVLPFGAVFTELFFIMSSLWHHQFYYLFGFLALVLVILVITCAEISIALTYFQLTSENYHWWWRAFFTCGSSSVYVFAYSILYFYTRLSIDKFVPTLLYFGYMFIISLLFFLLTGSIGLIATFYFVRAIYGSIKID